MAAQKAVGIVDRLTEKLKPEHMGLYDDAVYAGDLLEYKAMKQDKAGTGEIDRVRMPHGWDDESLAVWQNRLADEMAKPENAAVAEAVAKRSEFFQSMGKESEALGVLRPGQAQFREYYRHMIVQYERLAQGKQNARPLGPERLEAPKGRGYQHERVGSSRSTRAPTGGPTRRS